MSELGPLQKRIMDVIWRVRRASVQDVLDEINRGGRGALAYTTVMTVMTQLWEKGLLSRRKSGRAYIYRPTSDERGYNVRRIQEFFARLLGRDEKYVASHLLDALEDEDPDQIEALIKELKERKYL